MGVHLSLPGGREGGVAITHHITGCQPDSGNPTVEQPTWLQVLWGESPLSLIARFERLAYPMHMKVTTYVLLGWKSHRCRMGELRVRGNTENSPGPKDGTSRLSAGAKEEAGGTITVGAVRVASKTGGLNVRNDDDPENSPRWESAWRDILRLADPLGRSWGRPMSQRKKRARALWEPSGYGSKHPGKDLQHLTSGKVISQQGLATTCKDLRI